MITVINDLVASAIRAELAWRGMSQLDLANMMDKRPEYIQRRLSGRVQLSITDAEEIGLALGVTFIEPKRHTVRRASLCPVS